MKKIIIGYVILGTIISAPANTIFKESFDNIGNISYANGSYGLRFGISGQAVTDDSMPGKEGSGFVFMNENSSGSQVIGNMVIDLGMVEKEGITYTFSGSVGYRYGTPAAASDIVFYDTGTGFISGSGEHWISKSFSFGSGEKGKFSNCTFSYTTTEEDVGKKISVQLRLRDNGRSNGILIQLVADNWQVTASE